MEIKKVDDSLLLDLVNAAKEVKQDTKAEDVLGAQPSSQAVDSFDSNSFASLKTLISGAKEPGRDEYLEQLKSAVNSGAYNISDDVLVDALFNDGFAEALNSL